MLVNNGRIVHEQTASMLPDIDAMAYDSHLLVLVPKYSMSGMLVNTDAFWGVVIVSSRISFGSTEEIALAVRKLLCGMRWLKVSAQRIPPI